MFFNYIQPLNKRAVLLLHHQKQSYTNGPVTSALRKYIQSNEIQEDAQQLNLATKLDDLHKYLSATDSSALSHEQLTVETELNHRSYFSPLSKFAAYSRKAIQTNFRSNFRPNPKGIYVYGSVGVGKTFTMDLFFDECRKSNATTRRRQRRAHFHEFMLDVHERIHLYKKDFPKSDPIPPVALQIAQESQLLCFDEFQVTDIADAMIMKRLFSLLFDIGVVVVSTSNRPPNALYEGGLNRSQFLPFIDVLKDKCEIVSMDEVHDYRKDTLMPDVPYSYFYPSGSNETNASLETIFSGTELNELNESKESKLNNPKKKETEKDQRNNLLNLELWELQDELDSRGCDIDHKKWGGLSTKRKKKKLIFYLMKEMEKKNETTIDVFPQKEQFFEKRTEFRKNKQKEQKEKKELKELKELSMQSSTSMEEKDSIPETVHVDNYLNKNTLLDSLFKKNKRSSSNSSNSNTDMEKDNNFQLQHTMTPSEIQNFKNKIQNNMINDAASKSNTISNTKSNTKPDTISNTSNTIPNTLSNKTTKEIDTSTDKISKDEIIVSSDKNVKKKIVTNLNNIFQKYHKVEHVVKDVDIYGGDERREELAKFYRQENFKSNGKTNDPLQNANNQMPKMNKFDR